MRLISAASRPLFVFRYALAASLISLHPAFSQERSSLAGDEAHFAPSRGVLPDAPSASLRSGLSAPTALSGFSESLAAVDAPHTCAPAPGHRYPATAAATDVLIFPGQTAPRQSVRDKLLGAAENSIDPYSIAGEAISGGYSHLRNSSPNYGTNSGAFAQRFGAAVARGTSQNLFAKGATAAIFREDPRYYILGDKKPFVHRVAYALTRPLITRTDGGRTTANLSLLTGYLGAAALTKVYYPPPNQGFSQTLQTYGSSIGGAALGDFVNEFLPDVLDVLRLKK